jgi:pyruvate dehydrogenase E2 component (dihydrolipoamide acetyltransferase)
MQKTSNSGDRKFVSPIAKKTASDKGLDIDSIVGTGPNNRIILADVEEALKAGPVKVAKDVEVKKVSTQQAP